MAPTGEGRRKKKRAERPAERSLVRSVQRAGQILGAFLAHPEGLRLTELSEETGLHKSTLLRLLRTLIAMGVAHHDERSERYGWEPMVRLLLAQSVAPQSLDMEAVQGVLSELAEVTGQTAILSIPNTSRTQMTWVAHALPNVALRVEVRFHRSVPMERVPAGKVQLAYFAPEDLAAYLAARAHLPADSCYGSGEELQAELARIREQDYAAMRSRVVQGAGALSVPVYDARGRVVASLDLAGPVDRLTDENIAAWLPMMRAAAQRLSGFVYQQKDSP